MTSLNSCHYSTRFRPLPGPSAGPVDGPTCCSRTAATTMWRYLPHDFPPHQSVYGYFARVKPTASSTSSPACYAAKSARPRAAPASVRDSAAGTHLLAHVAACHPTITKAWADNGYKTKAVAHAAHLGIDLVVQRDPRTGSQQGSCAIETSNTSLDGTGVLCVADVASVTRRVVTPISACCGRLPRSGA